MGKRRILLHIPPTLGPICLVLFIVSTPDAGWSQQDLWEQLITQGNQALYEGALPEAEARYREALQVAEQFAPQDLRRTTARRNLAMTFVLQGRFELADSLYRGAIAIATQALAPPHPYVLSLKDELARLHEAMAKVGQLDESDRGPASIHDLVRSWALWLVHRLDFQLGTTLPLIGELGNTHDNGFGYGLSLHIPLISLGPLAIGIAAEHTATTLPALRTFVEPFEQRSASLALTPALGPLTLILGAGGYAVKTGPKRGTRLGLSGGISLAIGGLRTYRDGAGLYTAIRVRGIYLPDAKPVVEGPVTLLQADLSLGWRW